MARPVMINIPHALGKAEARSRIANGFGRIQGKLTGGLVGLVAFQERWEGDRLHFDGTALGQQITGHLDVNDENVQMQVELPAILSAIADRIVRTSQEAARKLLEKK